MGYYRPIVDELSTRAEEVFSTRYAVRQAREALAGIILSEQGKHRPHNPKSLPHALNIENSVESMSRPSTFFEVEGPQDF